MSFSPMGKERSTVGATIPSYSTERYPTMIVGADDCGGGSLAGPITAAAVGALAYLPRDMRGRLPTALLRLWWPKVGELEVVETKSAPSRGHIVRVARGAGALLAALGGGVGLGLVTPEERDALGDTRATGVAMQRATAALRQQTPAVWSPDLLIIDGKRGIPGVSVPQRRLPHADKHSWHVALASCLAYAHRQRWIEEQVKHAPWASGWRFTVHLGFPTEAHLAVCRQAGVGFLTPIHVRGNVTKALRKGRKPG